MKIVDQILKLAAEQDQELRGRGVFSGITDKSEVIGVYTKESLQVLQRIASGISVLASYSVLPADLSSRRLTIGTSRKRVIQGIDIRPHILLNPPPRSINGVVKEGTLLASQSSTSGNINLTPLDVGQYSILSLFINATVAGNANLNITPSALSPISGGWAATSSAIVLVAATTGETYVYFGSTGITSQFSLSWTTAGTAWTFGIGYSLKDNIGGTSIGGVNTVYLGNQNVVFGQGFPLIEGQITPYLPDPNVDLYAIANSNVDIFVFDL